MSKLAALPAVSTFKSGGPRPRPLYSHHEGFEINFVKQPAEELQLECPICLELLSDPRMPNCKCGTSLCDTCIRSLLKYDRKCPLCKDVITTVMPNRQLTQIINGLIVYCPHEEKGCAWMDQLGSLSNHINRTPLGPNRLLGCGFTIIQCNFCGKSLPRKDTPSHEESCPLKPGTCRYCGHVSPLSDLTKNHLPMCSKAPLTCPFECGETPQRDSLERHVTAECRLALVECEFRYAGCSVELPRRDMAKHMTEKLVRHLSMLSVKHKEFVLTVREEKRVLASEVEALKRENQSLKQRLTTVDVVVKKETQSAKQAVASAAVEREKPVTYISSVFYQESTEESNDSEYEHSFQPSRLPLELEMGNVERLTERTNRWTSASFWSFRGYKFKLSVLPFHDYLHLSVFLIKGEVDHKLWWPFRGKVKVVLVDPIDRCDDLMCVADFSCNSRCGSRRYNNCLVDGAGEEYFGESENLDDYLYTEDSFMFRIDSITDNGRRW